jgi:Lipid A 3-O-deacylase (PagL)
MKNKRRICFLSPFFLLLCLTAQAEDLPGRWVFGFQAAYGMENAIPRNISHINMLYAQPQVGIIAWNSPNTRLPMKRFEVISEGILGGSTHPGGHIFGDTLLFRFTGGRLGGITPIVDLGSGPLHTTINEHASELGGNVQFLSQGGIGIQRSKYVVEWRYFHMSNAGLTKPNHGFNGNMLSIGIRLPKRH